MPEVGHSLRNVWHPTNNPGLRFLTDIRVSYPHRRNLKKGVEEARVV